MASNPTNGPGSDVEERTEKAELSEREREILRLVATGASNKEIAQQLVISPNTVKVHVRNIFAKVGAASRTEATLYAIGTGLVQVPRAAGNGPIGEAVAAPPDVVGGLGATAVAETGANPRARRRRRQGWLFRLSALAIIAAVIAIGQWATRRGVTGPQAPTAVPTQVRWERKAPMSTARSGLAAAVYENQIYAIGGEAAAGVTGAVERYDPASDRWTELAPKPLAVADVSAAVVGGLIYVPGGRQQSGEISSQLEVYDARLDHWEQRAPLPDTLSGYGLVAFEGKLYVFGGWDGEAYTKSTYEYNPETDKWTERAAMLTARGFAGATVAGGEIYVIGGRNEQGSLATIERYQPTRDISTTNDPWQVRAKLPEPRVHPGAISVADVIFVIGGQGSERELAPMQYLPQGDAWLPVDSPISAAWMGFGTAVIETTVYIVGGLQDDKMTAQQMAYHVLFISYVPQIK